MPLVAGTGRCCSGCTTPGARGIPGRRVRPLVAGTWKCCSGRASTAPRGARGCARSAARSGHLRVLRWAREHHCPWDWLTPTNAAHGGHLAVLQWVRENGCPWNSNVCICAANAGQLEVLQWVWANDATGEIWDENRVRSFAGGPRKQEVLACLDELSAA